MTKIAEKLARVANAERYAIAGHRGAVVWLTGLPSSGKSTVAFALEKHLIRAGMMAFVLDGDSIRDGLSSDLGFSPEDRNENIRRVGQTAALVADAGVIAIAAFISPYRAGRAIAREAVGDERFLEVYLDVPVEVCAQRDPKGLYKKAKAGQLPDFTGVSAPYEPPHSPEVVLNTAEADLETCVQDIVVQLHPVISTVGG